MMNRIPCDVIRDLLPLYIDDVCSEKSKLLVEEHLAECEECRYCLEDMKKDLPKVLTPEEMDSVDELFAFLKKMGKNTEKLSYKIIDRMTVTKATIIVILIFTFIFGYSMYHTVETIPAKKVSVKEIYELDNGDLYVVLQSKAPIVSADLYEDAYRGTTKDIPNDSLYVQLNTQFWRFWDKSLPKEQAFIIYRNRPGIDPDNQGGHIQYDFYNSLHYDINRHSSESKLLWENTPGQKYNSAPDEIEEKIEDFKENPEAHFDDDSIIFSPTDYH